MYLTPSRILMVVFNAQAAQMCTCLEPCFVFVCVCSFLYVCPVETCSFIPCVLPVPYLVT